MAYGKKYIIPFKNRSQNDIFRIEVWQKDFAGDTIELTGAETPFTAAYTNSDTDILTAIKPVELTISINTNTLGIEDFYSDDDEDFRVDFYFESYSDGTGTEKLLHSGYLIEDGANEPVTDQKHVLTLKATDNLALLKSVKWNEAVTVYEAQFKLIDFVRICLKQTGLYSHDTTIDQNLPLRIYDNLFENTTDDRSVSDVSDPFNETVIYSNLFKNDDSTWQDCYAILEAILKSKNACIIQTEGYWNILRVDEYRLFSNGKTPGTEYIFNGSTTDITAVTLNSAYTIERGGQVKPVNEDQLKTIQRPLKYVINTFNYKQPVSIKNADLQLPVGATPFDTNTVSGIRYDDYALATYFPYWKQTHSDDSYLEVATEVSTEVEKGRYIVTIGAPSQHRGVQFNPISVSKGDVIDFNLQYRTAVDTDDELRFWIRFILILDDGNFYALAQFPEIGSAINVHWTGPFSTDSWDENLGIYKENTTTNQIDTTEYQQYSISEFLQTGGILPLLPSDGMLLIEVRGTNGSDSSNRQKTFWKDINLQITNFINESTQIVGQRHKESGNSLIKAIQENDILLDDSPRNSITGTLFTDALSNFDYTDTFDSATTDIGDIYFTKTTLWHRALINEAFRLGNIITLEIMQLNYTSRVIIEGTFKNLRYDTNKFISPITMLYFGWLTTKSFLNASMTIDYMACTFNGKFQEIYDTADILMQSVYLYGTKAAESALSNGNISFDTIGYFNGAADFVTPSISNSRFTYINAFDTTLDLSIIFYVPISGTGTATFTLLKNGVSIAAQTINSFEHFRRIDFLLTEAVTSGDYFEIALDNGGATVDIQSGSINLNVNNVISEPMFAYLFNFIYQSQ